MIELAAARQAFGIQLPDLWFFSSSLKRNTESKRGVTWSVPGKARVGRVHRCWATLGAHWSNLESYKNTEVLVTHRCFDLMVWSVV